jgi:hypothetical protein
MTSDTVSAGARFSIRFVRKGTLMRQSDWESIIRAATDPATRYLDSLPDRPVYRPADAAEIRGIVVVLSQTRGVPPETWWRVWPETWVLPSPHMRRAVDALLRCAG